MSETWKNNEWPIERIRTLTRESVNVLRGNCLTRNRAVAELCDQVLADGSYAPDPGKPVRRKRGASKTTIKDGKRGGKQSEFVLPLNAVDLVSQLLRKLPFADTVANGRQRRELQQSPVQTLGDLWRLFVVCGFSSQENAEDDGKLAAFLHADGPLLRLDKVRANYCDPAWVLSKISGRGLRFPEKKADLVIGNYAHFVEAGMESERLADRCYDNEKLKIFCELARGTVDDHDLAGSAVFSKHLKAEPFVQIGPKQLRNILVNGGLAHNIVPLDSRWLAYLKGIVPEDGALTLARYLLIEDLLRQALLSVQDKRADLTNLAVLDAVVFASQSKKGISPTAWYGMPRSDDGALTGLGEAAAA
ncbi:hypothetical protein LFL96_06270 [Paraburkholderia sp. D15]|uniref:hypothetical protein n=1 Tax=Paraburkholderia sp. D15 TaxID=2880218 RepID=UPI00247B1483|nr:hypothetical protein [Paraburkholderia sp. D15]WGS51105.1 hypothetical protein LFL96_06270 [Paraburkholderia sp. D15]